jgi:hypothetical protein
MNTLERDYIAQACGYQPVSCACQECEAMCRRTPCLGTPSDILRIINNGYGLELAATMWLSGIYYNLPPGTMVQFKGASKFDGACIMLDKHNRCQLHHTGLKPTEGQLVSHTPPPDPAAPLTFLVALLWDEEGQALTKNLTLRAMVAYERAEARHPKNDTIIL